MSHPHIVPAVTYAAAAVEADAVGAGGAKGVFPTVRDTASTSCSWMASAVAIAVAVAAAVPEAEGWQL
ncbi:hypothetical protein VMCG_09391 [Cytospora schulzeri]|uniref:Uncharacterized protein n=1 Tax=Cytospora schulzeri TaxID=448051 RepID=A0A423VIK3_9PEZI|nr:hypothetical protein VMCG_09391 [Valsa malicola]